jgi:hypothetical protein
MNVPLAQGCAKVTPSNDELNVGGPGFWAELLADAGLHESAPTEHVLSENLLIPDLINAGANSRHTGRGSFRHAWAVRPQTIQVSETCYPLVVAPQSRPIRARRGRTHEMQEVRIRQTKQVRSRGCDSFSGTRRSQVP